MRESHAVNKFQGTVSDIPLRVKTCKRRQEDIFQHAALREKLVILKNEPDVLISKGRQPIGGKPPRVFPEDFDVPGCGLIERSGQIEQRAFSASRWATNGNRRPGEHTQIDISKNGNHTGGRGKAPGDILHVENKRHGSRLEPGGKITMRFCGTDPDAEMKMKWAFRVNADCVLLYENRN